MSKGKEKRAAQKKERLARQEAALRRRRIQSSAIVAGVFIVSAALVVGAILLQLGKSEEPTKDERIEKLLGGIPQKGISLGSPNAPSVLLEWGDMQCSACASFAKEELPRIINEKVRPGKVRIEFRQWPILGPDSTLVAEAALAASLQNRYWQFIEYYYLYQEAKPSEELLEQVARLAGLDLDRWQQDRKPSLWEDQLLKNDEEALQFGISGTPSFVLRQGKSEKLLSLQSAADVFRQLP